MPLVGVTVILPLDAPLQLVELDIVDAANGGPAFTIILFIGSEQPKLSVIITWFIKKIWLRMGY